MAYNSLPSYTLTYRILLSTIRLRRMVPPLSREGNVLHAFLGYIDRFEVYGWRENKNFL